MNGPEFHLARWEADGSGAACPSCKGLGTKNPMSPKFQTKRGKENFLGVVSNKGVITSTGHYGPACTNCGGSGKIYQ